jgi:ParB family transcriptional regulator, chromosome partitioning protein
MAREMEILYLNPRNLVPESQNVRTSVGDLVGLAESIREHGLLQPLGVTAEDDAHRVVYGNRRREAAIIVGLDRVPCVLLEEQSDEDRLTCQLLENVQRKSLNDMEQGEALLRLREKIRLRARPGSSDTALAEDVAKKLGLSPRTVQRYIALAKLPPLVQEALRNEQLTVTQAQHLHALDDPARQEAVARIAVEETMSAAEIRRLCSALASNPNVDPREALSRLRRGDVIDDIITPVEARSSGPIHLPPAPKAQTEEDGDSEFWNDVDDPVQDDPEYSPPSAASSTLDGNRRFRIRSLDSFMDELARLIRCVEEGDLAKLAEADGAAGTKIALARRQVAYLDRTLETLEIKRPD